MDALWQFCAWAPATASLLAVIVVVGAVTLLWAPNAVGRYALSPPDLLEDGELVTLVTHGFLHADFRHLLFNSVALATWGYYLECEIGSARFVVLYMCGMLASSLASSVLHRRDARYVTLGASGAITAVVFAQIIDLPTVLWEFDMFQVPPYTKPLFVIFYLVYGVVAGRAQWGKIDHDAHVAGAVTGLVFMQVIDPDRVQQAMGGLFE